MEHVAQLWQVHIKDEARFLAYARHAETVRRPFGLVNHLVLKTGTTPEEYTVLLVWQDEASYQRWRASAERRQLLEQASYVRVGEPRRVHRVVLESDGAGR